MDCLNFKFTGRLLHCNVLGLANPSSTPLKLHKAPIAVIAGQMSIYSRLQNRLPDLMLAPFDVNLPRAALSGFEDTIVSRQRSDPSDCDSLWRAAFHSSSQVPNPWRLRLQHVAAVSAEMTAASVAMFVLVSWYPLVIDGELFPEAHPLIAKVAVLTFESAFSGNLTTVAITAMFTWARTRWLITAVVLELILVAGTARGVAMMMLNANPPPWLEYGIAANYLVVTLALCWRCGLLAAPFLSGSSSFPTGAKSHSRWQVTAFRTLSRIFFCCSGSSVLDQPAVGMSWGDSDPAATPHHRAPVVCSSDAAESSAIYSVAAKHEACDDSVAGDERGAASPPAETPPAIGTPVMAPLLGLESCSGAVVLSPNSKDAACVASSLAQVELAISEGQPAVIETMVATSHLSLACVPSFSIPPESANTFAVAPANEQSAARSAFMAAVCDPMLRRPRRVLTIAAYLFAPTILNVVTFFVFTAYIVPWYATPGNSAQTKFLITGVVYQTFSELLVAREVVIATVAWRIFPLLLSIFGAIYGTRVFVASSRRPRRRSVG